MDKIVIYQVLARLFGADSPSCVPNGSPQENGCGKMSDFTCAALAQIRRIGATHIWYTGLIEHATQTDHTAHGIAKDHPAVVKGRAGSPYAIKDYYDIDPDLADNVPERMGEFERLVARTHEAGLKMVIDFVPNHVARQYHSDAAPRGVADLGGNDRTDKAFSISNNFYYLPGIPFSPAFPLQDSEAGDYVECPARATGNDCFSSSPGPCDWYETVKLNYGVDYMSPLCGVCYRDDSGTPSLPDTWMKMRDILLFWADKGVDGFRCDMAEMVPLDFWGWVIPQVKRAHPSVIFIAEVYNPAEYRNHIQRGHFDYLYDKVGLYDTLRHVIGGGSATLITGVWQQVEDIQDRMLNFLENHDEQRLASDFFARSADKGKPALLVSALMGTNPFMLYFGQELGERGMGAEGFSGKDGRTTIFDYWTIDTIRRWRNGGAFDGTRLTGAERALSDYYARVLNLCHTEPAISDGQFFDLMYANTGQGMDERRQYAFLRKKDHDLLLIVANFADTPATASVKIPAHAFSHLGIPDIGECEAADLLTGRRETHTLALDATLRLKIPASGGKVLKFHI